MFFVPGIVLSIITFPGVIIHELAHQLFCRWCKVPVFKVVYFQFENPVGYVQHEVPQNKWHTVLISIGPFIVNSILAAIVAFPAALSVITFDDGNFLDYILMYLGISIGMHAFPSTGDANAIWHQVKDKSTSTFIKIFAYPIVGLIYLGSLGSFFWLDLLYGVGVAVFLPHLLVGLIA